MSGGITRGASDSVNVESRTTERRALLTLFALNGAMFVIEVTAGLAADSMGLVADGLDMLADAVVYGLSLYAIGRAASAKVNAALGAGYAQLALAVAAAVKLGFALVQGSAPEALSASRSSHSA